MKITKKELYALAGAFLIILVLTFNWAMRAAIHRKDVLVPDMVGKPLLQGLDLLAAANLGVRKTGAEPNNTMPPGTVLRQIPPAGSQVREGKIIRVVLSQGGESAFVPDVSGQTLRAAEITLRSNFLSLGEIRAQPSLKYPKDIVISQDPAPRSVVPQNALVHLTVSDGPPQNGVLLMPDFTGKTWDDVQNWAKGAGMNVSKDDDPNSTLPAGSVVKQDLAPDAVLEPGATAKFTISSNAKAAPAASASGKQFHFEVPQGGSAKQFSFVLVDSFGTRELWRGELEPGSKHDIPLPDKIGTSPRMRVFVDGILMEEKPLQ